MDNFCMTNRCMILSFVCVAYFRFFEIFSRSQEIQKDRLEKIRTTKKEAEIESCTFTPEISEFVRRISIFIFSLRIFFVTTGEATGAGR